MVLAYILLTTRGVDVSEVAKEVIDLEEVSNAHVIYGQYDMIIRVKAKNLEQLREINLNKISKIKGVDATTTLIVADQTNEDDNVAKL